MLIVSDCLAGINCRYNGGNNDCQWVKDFIKDKKHVLVCPEEVGGLPTPRPPCEIVGSRVMDENGRDVTDFFHRGAEETLKKAKAAAGQEGEEIELAILKANSPSCGCGKIYDGTFSHRLIPGDGLFTALLKIHGIPVITEQDEACLHPFMKEESEVLK